MIGSTRASQTAARAERRAGWRLRMRRVVAVVLAMTALVVVRPAPASAAEWWDSPTAKWYDGSVSYSQVLNCVSIIQGNPYYEYGVGAYVGYLADPEQARPAAGDKGWIRYRVYGLGNPCAGGSYFRPRFYLPSGMAWDTSRQIACGYDGSGGSAPQGNCPGWDRMDGSNAYWNNQSGDGGNMWGVAQGHYWEFQFPVVTSQPLSGAILDAHLDVADGNSNPQMLMRHDSVYVFSSTPGASPATVMYDQPSSIDQAFLPEPDSSTPATYGMLSQFQSVVAGRSGKVRLEISTSPTFTSLLSVDELDLPTGYQSINVWTDWGAPTPELSPGVTYYWRGVVIPTGQPAVVGGVQSFRLKAGGGIEPTTPGGADGGVGTGPGGDLGGVITPTPIPTPTPSPAPTLLPAPTPVPPATQPPAPTAKATVVSSAKAKKGVKVTVACTGACQAKATVTVKKKIAKKLRSKSTTIGKAKVSLTAAGTTVMTLRLSRAVRQRIAKLGKVTVRVKVTTMVNGIEGTTTKKVVIKG